MSYGCQQDVLKLDCFEQRVVEYISRQANSLANCAIYALKRSSRQAGQIDFNYYDLDKHLKQNKNYKNLFSQVAQQTLMSVCEAFKSHYEVMQLWYSGGLEDKPKMPRYRKSGGMSGFTYPAQHLNFNEAIETGLIRLPLGTETAKATGIKEIYIPAPKNIHPERIKEVRIFPRNRCFYVEWVYKRSIPPCQLNPQKALSIDPGIKNWLTCISNMGDSFIIDGKRPNFWNRTLNREVAKAARMRNDLGEAFAPFQGAGAFRPVSSAGLTPHRLAFSKTGDFFKVAHDWDAKRPHKGYWSKKLGLMTEKRNRRMRDYINRISRYIANYCINSGIGTVVFGWNQGIKNGSNLGKKNNQNFVQLPTAKLKQRLKVVLSEIGVNFVEVSEAYTSKASFLDGDFIPEYGNKPKNWKPSGKRIATKLYRTAKGWIINADSNAAANILKVASIPGVDLGEIARGSVTCPVRLNLYAQV